MTEVVRIPTVVWKDKNTMICTWAGLLGTDSGQAIDLSGFPDKTVQVIGTFDSTSMSLYGSNDPAVITDRNAGTLFGSKTASWQICADPQGNAITKTAAALETVLENPQYLLPVNTGGGGSANLKVIITASRSRI